MSQVNNRRRKSLWTGSAVLAEVLEHRQLPATFGVPWPDARNLRVSFPTDDTAIGAYRNSLRQTLDKVTDRAVWQETVLRAFQTWAVQANINIGLTSDRGDSLGAAGLSSGDPRFGELRIGAFPQPGVLASALPYQQAAGTWSGDVLLNTQTNWFLADWAAGSSISVPSANEKGPAVELFSVVLHEAGNALGVADNQTRGTVMFGTYQGPLGTLTATDIAAIRRIYGARRDVFEPVANNTRATATAITYPAGFTGQQPVIVRGSLDSQTDVDFYRFRALAGQEKVTVRLMASGVSLLKAKLEILDDRGQVISDAKVDSVFDNNLRLEVGSLIPGRNYFVRVSKNTGDVFAIGDYRVEIDYRDPSLQPSIVPPAHDADASDEDGSNIPYVDLDQLFSRGLVSTEVNANNTLQTASVLETTPGFLSRTRYEVQASLGSALDRDFYRFQAPATAGGILNIDVNPVGTLQPGMDLMLMNAQGDRVAFRRLDKAGGGQSIQVANPVPGATYVLGVRSLPASAVKTGNYLVTIDFATEAARVSDVFSGVVQGNATDYSNLRSNKSQLFRLDLRVSAATANEGIQLSFFNARTRDLTFTLSAGSGLTTTEYVWLPQGDYVITAVARTRQGQIPGRIAYSLRADVLSDDQGPNPVDPTVVMPPIDQPWNWVDYPPLNPPLISLPPILIEDPWLNENMFGVSANFYSQYYA